MNTFEFLDSIDDRVTSHVAKFQEVQAGDLGLDRRSAYRLYVDTDHSCIAVSKNDDRNLQYYGGFEYVDKDCRKELGNWVFYFAEDERVETAINHFADEEQFLERDDDNALMEDF